jgi:serine/threonine protein phosphatase 1
MAHTIVVGDIHGCFEELQALLDRVAPAADDSIIAIGDIVDRGPDSEKVLEFFHNTRNAVSLMGNHERKHIRSARGLTLPALSQKIVRRQLGDQYEGWLAFMATFPRHLELPEAILIHGMFEPGIPVEQQKDTVVIGTLTGEMYMAEKYPGPWYEHYTGSKPLIVGHHDYLKQGGPPLIHRDVVYGIDTGVPYGGRLTALVLPEFRIVSVPSRGDHWMEQRRRYAVLAGSSHSDLDLDWETLGAFAESHDRPGRSAEHQARAKNCETVARECDRLVSAILAAVGARCARTLAELGHVDDWASLSERKQAARFAQVVGKDPSSALLFAARRGELNKERLLRQAKTPRELMRMAAALGLRTPELEEVQRQASSRD